MWKRFNVIQWMCIAVVVLLGVTVVISLLPRPEDRGAVVAPTTSAPSVAQSSCSRAMEDAAAVPLAETNDDEFLSTLTSCQTPDEWMRALKANPGALGLQNLTDADMATALQTACWNADAAGVQSSVCSTARSQAIID